MIIKPIETPEETEGKANVHFQAWKEAYTGLIDQSYLDRRTPELSLSVARSAFEKGIAGFIAKDGERVAGFADYGPYRGDDLEEAGEVYAIYVLKEYYGKGVGSALMRRAVEAMPEVRRIAVWVLEDNLRATHFYENCGFKADGKKQTIRLGTPVTEIRMILKR